jgi:hypothetical protein
VVSRVCQNPHLRLVGSLVLRFAPAGSATHFAPRDMNPPAGRS